MFEEAMEWLKTAPIEELNEAFGFNKTYDIEDKKEDDYGDWSAECTNCGKVFHGLEGVFDEDEIFCKKCAKEEWGFGKVNLSEVDIQDLINELECRGYCTKEIRNKEIDIVETLELDKPTMEFIIKELKIKERECGDNRGSEIYTIREYFLNIMKQGGVLQFDKYGDWSFVKNECLSWKNI